MVDLPKDIVNPKESHPYVFPDSIQMRSYNPTVKGHKGQIKKALQILLAAKKPVLYLGGGSIAAECSELITSFAERLNLPVTNTSPSSKALAGRSATTSSTLTIFETKLHIAVESVAILCHSLSAPHSSASK